MATFTPIALTGSTDGRPIAVAATATPGTTIHTASASPGVTDVLEIVAYNIDASSRTLTLEWGGTSTSDNLKVTIAAGASATLPKMALQNGLIVKAFADSANKINIAGFVTRVS